MELTTAPYLPRLPQHSPTFNIYHCQNFSSSREIILHILPILSHFWSLWLLLLWKSRRIPTTQHWWQSWSGLMCSTPHLWMPVTPGQKCLTLCCYHFKIIYGQYLARSKYCSCTEPATDHIKHIWKRRLTSKSPWLQRKIVIMILIIKAWKMQLDSYKQKFGF